MNIIKSLLLYSLLINIKISLSMSEHEIKYKLDHAAQNNDIEGIKKLLIFKPRIELLNIALSRASQYGNIECIKLLIASGANINCADEWPPLILAAFNNKEAAVECLIKMGADVNLQFYTKQTAMHNITLNNREKLAKLFLEADYDINLKDEKGHTAYDTAKVFSSDYIIKLFEDKINEYKKLVYKAIKENNYANFKKYLLKVGSICFKDEEGNNLLHYAFEENNIEIAKIIYSINPELISQVNNNGQTPLSFIFNQEVLDFIKILIL